MLEEHTILCLFQDVKNIFLEQTKDQDFDQLFRKIECLLGQFNNRELKFLLELVRGQQGVEARLLESAISKTIVFMEMIPKR